MDRRQYLELYRLVKSIACEGEPTEVPAGKCTSPRPVRLHADGVTIFAPCRTCTTCLAKRRRHWIGRMSAERLSYKSACVLTLTYADAPYDFRYRDFQLFVKRLRFHFPDRAIKYFVAGERGSLRGRIHFHVALFGLSLMDLRLVRRKIGHISFWPHGHVFGDDASPSSFAYIAKYITKGGLQRMSQGLAIV